MCNHKQGSIDNLHEKLRRYPWDNASWQHGTTCVWTRVRYQRKRRIFLRKWRHFGTGITAPFHRTSTITKPARHREDGIFFDENSDIAGLVPRYGRIVANERSIAQTGHLLIKMRRFGRYRDKIATYVNLSVTYELISAIRDSFVPGNAVRLCRVFLPHPANKIERLQKRIGAWAWVPLFGAKNLPDRATTTPTSPIARTLTSADRI